MRARLSTHGGGMDRLQRDRHLPRASTPRRTAPAVLTALAPLTHPQAGVTFLSAVGSEFVEMFAGVAAARVNSLYYSARKKVGGAPRAAPSSARVLPAARVHAWRSWGPCA